MKKFLFAATGLLAFMVTTNAFAKRSLADSRSGGAGHGFEGGGGSHIGGGFVAEGGGHVEGRPFSNLDEGYKGGSIIDGVRVGNGFAEGTERGLAQEDGNGSHGITDEGTERG